jgi:arylsulfatase A
VAALEETGVAERTLLVFTSDNGPEVTGEVNPGVYDRAERYGHFSNGDLRGAKRDLWEGGHRVPFIARWPGRIPAGAVSGALIGHLDLFATVAELLEVELADDVAPDSVSFVSVMTGDAQQSPRDALVHHSGSGRFAIRRGSWVLIEHSTGDDNGPRGETPWYRAQRGYTDATDQPKQLFDLAADPAQHVNLFRSRPEKADELHRALVEIVDRGRSTPGTVQANDVEVVIEKP